MTDIVPVSIAPVAGRTEQKLWEAAKSVEATFLSEMLKQAGVGEARDMFGGGAGEDQFASFLRQEQARDMVDAGGIGLAEHIFEALKKAENDDL